MLEKEGNTAALSGEVIMESFENPEDEVKLNTLLLATYIILSYYSSPPFFPLVSNLAVEYSNENVSREEEGT